MYIVSNVYNILTVSTVSKFITLFKARNRVTISLYI